MIARDRKPIISLLAIMALVLAASGIAEAPAKVSDRIARLQSGEIFLEPSPLGPDLLMASGLIPAPWEKLWSGVTEYELFFRIFPENNGAEAKERGEGYDVVCFKMRRWFSFNYCLRRQLDKPGRTIKWRQESGDFKALNGIWRFEPTADGQATIASFGLDIDTGFWLPKSLMRRENNQSMINTVRRMRDWAVDGTFAQ